MVVRFADETKAESIRNVNFCALYTYNYKLDVVVNVYIYIIQYIAGFGNHTK